MTITRTPLHDASVCISCGVPATVRPLDPSHVIARSQAPDRVDDPTNIVLQCRLNCHELIGAKKARQRVEDGVYVYEVWSEERCDFEEITRIRVVVDKKRGHLVEDDSVLSAAAGGVSTGGTPSQRSEPQEASLRVGSSAAAPSAGQGGEAATPPQVSPSLPLTSLDDWCRRGMGFVYNGERLEALTDEWRFQVGEWLNEGEGMMPEEVYGYLRGFRSPMALRQYAWVAGVVTRVTGL